MSEQKHVCGLCKKVFNTEKGYCDHECAETGYTPKDNEHFGEDFKAISEAALARGAEKAEK